jgi:hypothetical protein
MEAGFGAGSRHVLYSGRWADERLVSRRAGEKTVCVTSRIDFVEVMRERVSMDYKSRATLTLPPGDKRKLRVPTPKSLNFGIEPTPSSSHTVIK